MRLSYVKTLRIWNLTVFSLPLDLLLITLGALPASLLPASHSLNLALYISLAATLVLTPREAWLEFLKSARQKQQDLVGRYGKQLYLALGIILAIMSLEVIVPLTQIGLPILAVGGLIVLVYFRSIKKAIISWFRHGRLATDYTQRSEHTTDALTILVLAPILSARAVGVIGIAASASSPYPVLNYSLYGVVSFLLLLSLTPEISLYYIRCKRCALLTSTNYMHHGCCNTCLAREIQV